LACLALLTRRDNARLTPGWRLGLTGSGFLFVAGSVIVLIEPTFLLSEIPGPFHAARLEPAGRYVVLAELVATAGVLGALEAALRISRGPARWRHKYLIIGLGGIFLARFYLQSHVALFHVLLASYLTTQAGTLLVGTLFMAASVARGRLAAGDLIISRHVVYRSIVVGVLGAYLFVIGALGWVLTRLGIAEELFWGSLAFFVSALTLTAVLLSEHVRWRIKRFIGLNFYRSKYDYRQQWTAFTKRLGSLVTVEELAPQLLHGVTEAIGVAKGALYLADGPNGDYHAAATREISRPPSIHLDDALAARLRATKAPVIFGPDDTPGLERLGPEVDAMMHNGGAAVPLMWRGDVTGFMLIGSERTGAPYTVEDVEFLATVGEQAAVAIVTARLSETLAQTREFDTFNRLTSFVIHDLKNSVSALSLLSQNALANFDDPEFQRDAMKTLSKTVDRMNALLAKMSSSPEATSLRFRPVELSAIVAEAMPPAKRAGVSLVTEIAAVPPVIGDHEALLRIVQNLVKNAVEALNGTGVVTVRVYGDDEHAVVAVSDTGCGMSEEFVRKSLFAPFRSTKKAGWGIGLYQAKGIVEAHRGRIEVLSKEGEGTTFWVKLPIARR
jgi:hypothetical protein